MIEKELLKLQNGSDVRGIALEGIAGDELRRIGLDVPECAKLANLLREKGFDVPEGVYSMEDVKAAILNNLRGEERKTC